MFQKLSGSTVRRLVILLLLILPVLAACDGAPEPPAPTAVPTSVPVNPLVERAKKLPPVTEGCNLEQVAQSVTLVPGFWLTVEERPSARDFQIRVTQNADQPIAVSGAAQSNTIWAFRCESAERLNEARLLAMAGQFFPLYGKVKEVPYGKLCAYRLFDDSVPYLDGHPSSKRIDYGFCVLPGDVAFSDTGDAVFRVFWEEGCTVDRHFFGFTAGAKKDGSISSNVVGTAKNPYVGVTFYEAKDPKRASVAEISAAATLAVRYDQEFVGASCGKAGVGEKIHALLLNLGYIVE
jgi:hypothetical protein